MGKNKMIAKSCPKCEMQVAVASKSCKCGHIFFSARRAAEQLVGATIAGGVGPGDDIRRRTSRVRRAQPQFYDSQHYQKQQTRRVRSPKKRSLSESVDESYKAKDKERGTSRARRRRALRRGKDNATTSSPNANTSADKNTPAATAGDIVRPPLRPTQLARAALILHEINRKMKAVVWQPSDG